MLHMLKQNTLAYVRMIKKQNVYDRPRYAGTLTVLISEDLRLARSVTLLRGRSALCRLQRNPIQYQPVPL